MEIFLITLGGVLLVSGFVGSILPVIPGPPISYVGLIAMHLTEAYGFTAELLAIYGVLSGLVVLLDYVIPIYGSRQFGASQYGIWGTGIGAILGAIFFPPFGIIIGPFLGAVMGEMIKGKNGNEALKAGLGSFIGFLAGTLIKLIVSGLMTYHFIEKLLSG